MAISVKYVTYVILHEICIKNQYLLIGFIDRFFDPLSHLAGSDNADVGGGGR